MLKLNKLVKIKDKRKVVGRGGSRGGTSGRGGKGQTARSGGSIHPRFEGGQMPLSRRLPKRGFNNNMFRNNYTIVSLKELETWFEDGATINKTDLVNKINCKPFDKIKILGSETISKKFFIEIDAASKFAQQEIERVGGSIKFIEVERKPRFFKNYNNSSDSNNSNYSKPRRFFNRDDNRVGGRDNNSDNRSRDNNSDYRSNRDNNSDYRKDNNSDNRSRDNNRGGFFKKSNFSKRQRDNGFSKKVKE